MYNRCKRCIRWWCLRWCIRSIGPNTANADLKRVDAAYQRRPAAQPRLEGAPQLLGAIAAGAHEDGGRECAAQP